MVNISERPAQAADRAVPGHWKGDLLYGQRPGVIATLVERHSRFVMLVGLPETHRADVVAAALAAKTAELPHHLRRSLTWDQGREMAQHAVFTVASGVPVYFCDPRSPRQRGSNENTNGLLCQYLHRKSRLGDHTQLELDAIAEQLNGRPRQTLGCKTPSQALDRAMR
jgi:IS30 family transposase